MKLEYDRKERKIYIYIYIYIVNLLYNYNYTNSIYLIRIPYIYIFYTLILTPRRGEQTRYASPTELTRSQFLPGVALAPLDPSDPCLC